MKRRLLEGKKLEWLALSVFVIAQVVVAVFHEPWFDEAQAWQIAKCASLKELLFFIPHYEGHPPLWHLILALPAKLGVPFEIGLKSVGFVFAAASAALVLFRSKLPRTARLLLPFSYFFFYQYGVIVRPYGLMMLVMLLLGMEFPAWNARPWRVVGLLILLCLTCAYGIVLAGGIAICMLWELLREKGFAGLLRELLRDRRTKALLCLLVCALLLIAEILPRPDTYSPTVAETDKNSFLVCLLCSLLTFPGECFFTTGSWFAADRTLLQNTSIPLSEMIAFCAIGLLVWLLLICVSSRKNLRLLLVPYLLFAAFSAKVYFSGHHLGVIFIFLLFWFEVQCRDKGFLEIGRAVAARIAKTDRDRRLLRALLVGAGCLCLLFPIYWTVSASTHDLTEAYSFGRGTAEFLKENEMEDSLILTNWNIGGTLYPQSEGNEDYVNPYMAGTGAEVSAYFSRNMALDLNNGDDHMAYTWHRLGSYEEGERVKAQWRAKGAPELIIGRPKLSTVYGDTLSYSDYSLVKIIYYCNIWKTDCARSAMPIYLRNDLLSRYGLSPITGKEEMMFSGLTVTDEMRAQYESGVPVEEIIEPYLDALFGEEK